ncbi:hypothetical protein [Streptomyces sp. WG7]|uniref:hypothetical protein n=1 Tax=Streptomyces sp. WG7 TaxID=3417650 RepID=UPI003CF92BB6
MREQALNEHEHWLREQRLQAYRAMLVAFDEYALATTQMSQMLGRPRTDTDPRTVDIGTPANGVTSARMLIMMLGPERVRDPATQLWERVYHSYHSLSKWRKAFMTGDDASAEQARADWSRLSQMGSFHAAFVQAATEAVADPRPSNGAPTPP